MANEPHLDAKLTILPENDIANFEKIMNEINSYMEWHKQQETPPAISEIDQFHKSWFYNNWQVRFRHLSAFSNLGTRGVIAIPNTTFEEWLWWFHEWAEALTDDYNRFKQMVYEALQLIQKHLEAIDEILKDHERRLVDHEHRITELERQMREVQNEIKNIKNDIQNLRNEVNKLGDQINQLKQQQGTTSEAVNKILQKLKDIGVWNQTGDSIQKGEFNPGMGIAGGNINFFGGAADGNSWIRTNNGQTENDVTAGI